LGDGGVARKLTILLVRHKNEGRTWTQSWTQIIAFGSDRLRYVLTSRIEKRFRQIANDACCAHVGLACPLGVAPQQHRRIMPTTRRYDVYGHTSIQEGRLVAPTEIMESDSGSHCCLPSRSICGCQKNFTRRSKFEAASTGHSPKKKSISELPK